MSESRLAIPYHAQVVDVITYPVKSLAGVSQPGGVPITENGLEGDRLFMLAGTDKDEHGFAKRLTLREHPELTQIATEYTEEGVALTAESVGRLILPYNINEGTPLAAKAWGGPIMGLSVSQEANTWLGDFLKRSDVQVLAVSNRHRRVLDKNEQPPQASTFTGRGTDGYPLHVASLASLRQLNQERIQANLSVLGIENFRANILLDGLDLEPFMEDRPSSIRLQDEKDIVDILSVKACKRCVTVEVDPTTGEKLGNVLKSLKNLQLERHIPEKIAFGIWAAPSQLSIDSIVRAGQLLKWAPPYYET